MFWGILCYRWDGIYLEDTSSDAFCVIDGMRSVWSTILRCIFCPGSHRRRLVHTWWEGYCVHPGILGVCSTNVILMPSLVWDGFGQHLLRYTFFPRWDLVNTCWVTFCVFAGMVKHLWWYILCPRWHLMAWSTFVAMDFLFVLAWERLVNTCWDTISVHIGKRGG